MTNFQQSSLQI